MYGQITLQPQQVLKYQLSEVLERALIGCAIDILIWCLPKAATPQRFTCGVRLPNSSTLVLGYPGFSGRARLACIEI